VKGIRVRSGAMVRKAYWEVFEKKRSNTSPELRRSASNDLKPEARLEIPQF
jgi:hypothetical protein